MKQNDIEIYLKDATLERTSTALAQLLELQLTWQQTGKVYKSKVLTHNMSITWYPKAVEGWNCLYINNNQTPWLNDLECAIALSKALAVETRCMAESWTESSEDKPEIWLKVNAENVQEIPWKTQY